MFNEYITDTPLTNPAADRFFSQRITGDSWDNDLSFLATLRALIYHRMNEGETVDLKFTSSTYDMNILEGPHQYKTLESATFGDALGILSEGHRCGLIQVHEFKCRNAEANAGFIHLVEENFLAAHADWVRIEKITDFYRNIMKKENRANVLCYVNPSERKVLLLCDRLTLKTMHYLQCAVLAYMPWYFNQEDGVTELEMELTRSLSMTTSEKYIDCLQRIADEHDFQTEYIKSMLEEYQTSYERIAVSNEQQRLDDIDYQIRDMQESFSVLLRNRRDLEIRIAGLKDSIAQGEGEHEVMDYFLSNSRLFLQHVENTRLEFAVKDYLEFYDPEKAESDIENDRSYLYRLSQYSKADTELLMTAIFLEQKLKIKVCAAYYVDVTSLMHNGISNYRFGADFDDAMPNPHIQQYQCIGDHYSSANTALTNGDVVGTIAQYITSCKSLNFYDSCVMESFVSQLTANRYRCIELPDGKVVKPSDAIIWLREQEKANAETEEQGNE